MMNSAFARFITAMMYLMVGMYLWAETTPMEGVKHAQALPSYVLVVDDGHEMTSYQVPDTVFNRIAGHTIFRVNRTELNPADPFLHELIDSVLPMANDQEWMLVGIDLRGAASPEGPYNNNVRLSKGRSSALIDLMSSKLDSVYINEATISTVAEDYGYLLWLMEEALDPDAPTVRTIVERYGLDRPADIKRTLRRHDGGRLWSRIYRVYFPVLRSARVVLFFRRVYPERRVAPAVAWTYHPLTVSQADAAGAPLVDVCVPQPRPERTHALAVSTNLLYDVFYMPNYGWAPMPNVQLEYFPEKGNYTFQIGFLSPYYHRWSHQQFFQIRDYHIEVRRYFSPGKHHLGPYLALFANANKYGIGLSASKGWEGEGYGGALKFGYVKPLGRGRWRLDLHLAVGAYVTRYDPYVYGNPITGGIDGDYYYDYTGLKKDFVRRNHRFTWFGPTEIGITITYDLLFHKPH